MEKQLLR